MIALTPNEIHLWLAFYDEIDDESLHMAYRALLNDEEKKQEGKFYFAKDRRRYLVTRALVRTVLSRYLSLAPKDWEFAANAYGRPEIANADAHESRLVFNLSHAHSLIVLGVTKSRALGVDVENVRAREVSIDIADRYFAPEEAAELYRLPADCQRDRFFEYWTFKESYIKARGMGLSIPLDQFGFRFQSDRTVQIAIHPSLQDDATRWQFWQFRPTAEYLVAICAERAGLGPPNVTVRKVVPMAMEEVLAATFLRTSE